MCVCVCEVSCCEGEALEFGGKSNRDSILVKS